MSTNNGCALDRISDTLSLAVLSDLHAFDSKNYGGKENHPSFLNMSEREDSAARHPIASLKNLIKKENLRADIVICAGDMGDKAHPAAIQYAWSKLHELKEAIGAYIIGATPGNHDHDSRSIYCEYDPRGALQSLSPKFPFQSNKYFNEFWAKNFVIIRNDKYRFVLFNSSAFHGISKESNHGRISNYTLETLTKELSIPPQPQINIFVCHHHPFKNENIGISDYDNMEGGSLLLKHLGSANYGNWIVIHGHKHIPNLSYAQGGTGGPIIFSAGSLCGFLNPEISTSAKNQFYMIKFDIEKIREYGFVGRFQAWDWVYGTGWQPATIHSGLPAFGGFGLRTQIDLLSDEIAKIMGRSRKKDWDDLLKSIPKVNYLSPGDLNILEINLKNRHSLNLIKSAEGLIIQIGAGAGNKI
jgi:predicted phosphodiesterase